MPYLLPDDVTPTDFKCLTIRIPDDPQWESTFWGNMLQLCRWFNFDRDPEHKATIVAKVWCELMEEAMSCNTITGIRFSVGKLQVQFCNSATWVNVGSLGDFGVSFNDETGQLQFDLNGDGIIEVSQYLNSYQNVLGGGLPTADANDAICRASWMLARVLCDNFADLVGAIKLTDNTFASAAQALFDLTMVPYFDDIIEFVTQDLPQSVLEFMQINAKDPETIRAVAEMIYCSLQINYPDNLNEVLDDIPLGIYAAIIDFPLGANYVKWGNFKDIAESIFATFTGSYVKYLVIGYAVSSISAFTEIIGVYQSTEQVMQSAINTAVFFDARDCIDFECAPQLIVTFDEETNTVPYTLSAYGTVQDVGGTHWLRKTGAANNGEGLHRVQFTANFLAPVFLNNISCKVFVQTSPASTPRTLRLTVLDGATEIHYSETTHSDPGTHELTGALTEGTYNNLIVRLDTGTLVGSTQDLRIDDILFEGV